jgi:hypothetical protein
MEVRSRHFRTRGHLEPRKGVVRVVAALPPPTPWRAMSRASPSDNGGKVPISARLCTPPRRYMYVNAFRPVADTPQEEVRQEFIGVLDFSRRRGSECLERSLRQLDLRHVLLLNCIAQPMLTWRWVTGG